MGKLITVDGAVYVAEEIIFHTPSEHTINGQRFDMEMQIIHRGKTKGDIAKNVLFSVLFKKKPGFTNKFIDQLDIFNLPFNLDNVRQLAGTLFIPDVFVSSERTADVLTPFSFYTYQGSLTSPPCSERTIVYVTAKPAYIGMTALAMITEAIKERKMSEINQLDLPDISEKAQNYRETQNLNGRAVFYYDHLKYSGPANLLTDTKDGPSEQERLVSGGHFEKIQRKVNSYFFVDSDSPSGMPGSYVVPEKEAVNNS